jgi:hypothetical protein
VLQKFPRHPKNVNDLCVSFNLQDKFNNNNDLSYSKQNPFNMLYKRGILYSSVRKDYQKCRASFSQDKEPKQRLKEPVVDAWRIPCMNARILPDSHIPQNPPVPAPRPVYHSCSICVILPDF